jgi:exosortase/archaeosortase family protein
VTILLWAAMLAFPASWRMKVLGVLVGSLAIQIVNMARFISLFYIGQYSRSWFDFAHEYLWETLLILDTMVVFSLVSKTAFTLSDCTRQ